MSPVASHDTGDRILDAIVTLAGRQGYPPSVREIGAAVGITSTSHVVYWLTRLEGEGWITRTPGIARSIRVMEAVA